MACCCDQNDDEEHLTEPLTTNASVAASDAALTISPLNSNFTALSSPDTLRLILQRLSVADLARARCVCRRWNALIDEDEIVIRAFMAPWKVKEVVGRPVTGGVFWRENGIGRFAISHRVCRGDSVASLAVKYSVQVMDLKRLNNMMSDHGIYSRERLLIPISNPDLLVNSTCYIELDTYAKREVAVLYLEGGPDRKHGSVLSRASSDRGKRRIIDSLRRSMQVDDGTAQYYLAISNGDPRAALSEFSSDLSWERQAGVS